MAIIDNRTPNLNLPLPNVDNLLEDDVARSRTALGAIDAAIAGKQATLGFTPESTANKGAASGYVPLGSDLKVASAYLPSYVDDVVEAATTAALPVTGETGKIYVTLDANKTWRWSGSAYVEISASPGSTDAVTEGVTNRYFTVARVRDAVLTGLSTTTNAVISATDTVLTALGKLQKQVTDSVNLAGTQTIAGAKTFSNAVRVNSTVVMSSSFFRNRLSNGSFAINQRGYVSGTATVAGVYMHDRWKATTANTRYSFTQIPVDTTITITAGTLAQIVENTDIEGGVYILSWTGTATARVAINGDVPSAAFAASPIITGDATGGYPITVEFSTGTVGKVQLEPGAVATPFERRHYGAELALCQRYFGPVIPFYRRCDDVMTNGQDGGSVSFQGQSRAGATVSLTLSGANSYGLGNIVATDQGASFSFLWITGGPLGRDAYVIGTYDSEL